MKLTDIPDTPFAKNKVTNFMQERLKRRLELLGLGDLTAQDLQTPFMFDNTEIRHIPRKLAQTDDLMWAFAHSFGVTLGENAWPLKFTKKINP